MAALAGLKMQSDPAIQQFILKDVCSTGRVLGSGAYGSVEALEIHGMMCAGKKIHDIFFESSHKEQQHISAIFVRECQILSSLRHPHVVQFIGLYFCSSSVLPILVMEYLPMSLDECISTMIIPLPLKRSILHDTACALAYLHEREQPIIHRDLSAKNVLLSSNMQAKLADLGVARIVDIRPGQLASTMTAGPGTLVYMPPEAMGTKPKYDTSLDIFSFGVLTLYTITQTFPIPESATTIDEKGKMLALTEVQRRTLFLEEVRIKLGCGHGFEKLIVACLDNKPEHRPSIQQVLQQLVKLKAQVPDPYECLTRLEMIQRLDELEDTNQKALETLKQKEEKLTALGAKLETVKDELQAKGYEYKELLMDMTTLHATIRKLEGEARMKSDARRPRSKTLGHQQKRERPHFQKTPSLPERFVESLRGLGSKSPLSPPAATAVREGSKSPETSLSDETLTQVEPPLRLQWQGTTTAPFQTSNQAAVTSEEVWVVASRIPAVAGYNVRSRKWNQTRCPVKQASIVTFNDQLALVGGMSAHESSVKSLHEVTVYDIEKQGWITPYPAMHAARCDASVVAYKTRLVVAGGWDYIASTGTNVRHNSVEILDSQTMQWFMAEPIPAPSAYGMSSTMLKDNWFLLGGNTGRHAKNTVFSVSLPDLIYRAISQSSVASASPLVWKELRSTPLKRSTAVVIGNHLLAVGGINEKGRNTSRMYVYMPDSDRWLRIGDLPSPRCSCTCAMLSSTNELFVSGEEDQCKHVDLATVIVS